MKKCLQTLIDGHDLSLSQCDEAIQSILAAESPEQSAALLALLQARGLKADVLYAFAKTMRQHMTRVEVTKPVVDIVGTGGDGTNTVNISTATALLVASVGVAVVKHGNRAASSQCGSADVLAELGVDIHMNPQQVTASVQQLNFGFCFAPDYHPAMQKIKALRRALQVPTVFNLLGPLLNPAAAQYMLVGVADPHYLEMMAHVLRKLGVKQAYVVHGQRLDELSCLGPAKVISVSQDDIHTFSIDPKAHGLATCELSALVGGDAKTNATKIIEVFSGKSCPLADSILLNAAVALLLYHEVDNIDAGLQLAQRAIDQHRPLQLLTQLRGLVNNKEDAGHA